MIILSENSLFVQVESFIYMINCCISSYVYSWMAAFGHDPSYKSLTPYIVLIELMFIFHIYVKFTTDYVPDGEQMPVKNLLRIAKRYVNSKAFKYDIIPLIPFNLIFKVRINKIYRVFYFIKLFRILKGLEIFNVQKMMATIGAAVQARTKRRIEKDPTVGENVDEDNNSINMLTNIGYFLKIMKLITFIFNFSYFMGILWTVACDILNDKYLEK